jgi:hypothetical protein
VLLDLTDMMYRCTINAEYFPTANGMSVDSALSEEDQEMLAALRELAVQGISNPLVGGRYML